MPAGALPRGKRQPGRPEAGRAARRISRPWPPCAWRHAGSPRRRCQGVAAAGRGQGQGWWVRSECKSEGAAQCTRNGGDRQVTGPGHAALPPMGGWADRSMPGVSGLVSDTGGIDMPNHCAPLCTAAPCNSAAPAHVDVANDRAADEAVAHRHLRAQGQVLCRDASGQQNAAPSAECEAECPGRYKHTAGGPSIVARARVRPHALPSTAPPRNRASNARKHGRTRARRARPRAHHVRVLGLVHDARAGQLYVEVLVNRVQHARDGQVVLELNCHLARQDGWRRVCGAPGVQIAAKNAGARCQGAHGVAASCARAQLRAASAAWHAARSRTTTVSCDARGPNCKTGWCVMAAPCPARQLHHPPRPCAHRIKRLSALAPHQTARGPLPPSRRGS